MTATWMYDYASNVTYVQCRDQYNLATSFKFLTSHITHVALANKFHVLNNKLVVVELAVPSQ